jgi:hypothetical protein
MSTSVELLWPYAGSSRKRTFVQYMFHSSRNLASESNTVRVAGGCLQVGSPSGRLAVSRVHDPDGHVPSFAGVSSLLSTSASVSLSTVVAAP